MVLREWSLSNPQLIRQSPAETRWILENENVPPYTSPTSDPNGNCSLCYQLGIFDTADERGLNAWFVATDYGHSFLSPSEKKTKHSLYYIK